MILQEVTTEHFIYRVLGGEGRPGFSWGQANGINIDRMLQSSADKQLFGGRCFPS